MPVNYLTRYGTTYITRRPTVLDRLRGLLSPFISRVMMEPPGHRMKIRRRDIINAEYAPQAEFDAEQERRRKLAEERKKRDDEAREKAAAEREAAAAKKMLDEAAAKTVKLAVPGEKKAH